MCSTVAAALAAFSAPGVVLAADAAAEEEEEEEDTLGRVAMAHWVIDGRARGVMAVFNRTGPEVEDGEEGVDEDEALAEPATITRGFLIGVIRDGTKGPGRLLRESITTRLALTLARRVSHASWRAFWLSKATKVIG